MKFRTISGINIKTFVVEIYQNCFKLSLKSANERQNKNIIHF